MGGGEGRAGEVGRERGRGEVPGCSRMVWLTLYLISSLGMEVLEPCRDLLLLPTPPLLEEQEEAALSGLGRGAGAGGAGGGVGGGGAASSAASLKASRTSRPDSLAWVST